MTLSQKVGGGQDEIILLGAAKIVTRWVRWGGGLSRLFSATQKPLPQSLTNVTDFSKLIPTIETFFRVEGSSRRLVKMKW